MQEELDKVPGRELKTSNLFSLTFIHSTEFWETILKFTDHLLFSLKKKNKYLKNKKLGDFQHEKKVSYYTKTHH